MNELVLVANALDGTLSTLRLHRGIPDRLTVVAVTPGLPACGTFAVDLAAGRVYAASASPEGAAVVTLALDVEAGTLRELTCAPVPAKQTYLALAPDGRHLLGVSYGAGRGWVWPLSEAGVVGAAVAEFAYPNLHCVVTDGSVAYAVSLGADLVAQFALGPGGSLTPLDPPTVGVAAGSGPRHLVLDGAHAYLSTEFSGEVIHLRRDRDGRLAPVDTLVVAPLDQGLSHSRIGADPRSERLFWGADVHRTGGFVLTSERTSSTIATTALGPGGVLDRVVARVGAPEQPRGFAVSRDGRRVVAVGERSTTAVLYRVEDDGELTAIGEAPVGRGATWVEILPVG
ncbi:MAG TPA: beta-propeller fold lactonase family protein [Phycicoccus sp.]|nr:beta-propeller fold lactonase family protein [Phycicoccus sp.]